MIGTHLRRQGVVSIVGAFDILWGRLTQNDLMQGIATKMAAVPVRVKIAANVLAPTLNPIRSSSSDREHSRRC
jgi:hypothetical protein